LTTIHDIARHAGVSVATVSRTLHDPGAVRPAKREKVLLAVSELNYTPNAIARQLRRPRAETIIVIVPEIANPFFSGIIQSIENAAHELGYRVLIGESQARQDRLDYYADMVLTRVANGLILLGSLLPTVVRASFDAGNAPMIPLVLACERFDGLDCPNVQIDNEAAGALAVLHLAEQGCTRIATITGPLGNTLSQDRLRGYHNAIAAQGLASNSQWVAEGDFTIDSGYTAIQRLLNADTRPDAVFCANDEMAIGAQAAIREIGLAMPDDIAIVGFDDLRFGAFATPPLTTIRQPTTELGETAVRMMDGLLQKRHSDAKNVILPHELVVRASSLRC
jgi:LacI family transcriptional regulator, repressor for deo operon, udp, cdd, tsx, nupC, and nupG